MMRHDTGWEIPEQETTARLRYWPGRAGLGKGGWPAPGTHIYLMPAKGDTSVSGVYTHARTGDGCIYIISNNEHTRDVLDADRPRPLLHVKNKPARARSPVRGWWARIWIFLLFVRSTRMERTHLTRRRESCSRLEGVWWPWPPPLLSSEVSKAYTSSPCKTWGTLPSRIGSWEEERRQLTAQLQARRQPIEARGSDRLQAGARCWPRTARGQVSLVADRGSQAKVRLVSLACSGWWLSIKNGGDR